MPPRVILFLIDGMRPDGLQQATAPTMKKMIKNGLAVLNAQTTFPSVTLPCHASLFLGVPPERHGILTNQWMPQVRPIPGIVEVLRHAGLKSGFFYNWENLRDLSCPGMLSTSVMLDNLEAPVDKSDYQLTEIALRRLQSDELDFAYIYLGKTDEVGHDEGWMSRPYLEAIHHADVCISRIQEAMPEDVTYLVISDHGGHKQSHGTNKPEDMTIPVIIQGPNIPVGVDIKQPVTILDIAPTIINLFKLKTPKPWVGKPLLKN